MRPGNPDTESAGNESCPRSPVPSKADFVIVGGGYVGLHTAIELARTAPGSRIIVLEREHCGFGASGRNGGQVHSWWNQIPTLSTICGREEAKLLAEESVAAIERIGELSNRHPEVDFRQSGWLWTASTEAQQGSWDACLAECDAQGVEPFAQLSGARLEEKTGTSVTRSGVFESTGGTVNPQGLVDALKQEATELGVEVFERTPVLEVSGHGPASVRTPNGDTAAGKVILTTNAWAARNRALQPYLYVVGSDIVLTNPLHEISDEHLPEVGLAACDSQPRVLYWSLRGDRRLAFGRGGGRIAPFNRIGRHSGGATRWRRDVITSMKRVYPKLGSAEPATAWSGAVDRTIDGFPIFGQTDRRGPLYGVGWSGSGVVGSALGGRILASLACERDDFWSGNRLVTRRPIRLPREPLRTIGAHIVRSAVRQSGKAEEQGTIPNPVTRKVAAMAPSLEADPESGPGAKQ